MPKKVAKKDRDSKVDWAAQAKRDTQGESDVDFLRHVADELWNLLESDWQDDEQRIEHLMEVAAAAREVYRPLDAYRVKRTISILDWGLSMMTAKTAGRPWTSEEVAGSILQTMRVQDPDGLGSIPFQSWKQAVEKWPGSDKGTRGRRGAPQHVLRPLLSKVTGIGTSDGYYRHLLRYRNPDSRDP